MADSRRASPVFSRAGNSGLLKVLSIATVFPSVTNPLHGLFVYERLRHAALIADMRVVAPLPWYRRRTETPAEHYSEGLNVYYPTYYYVPRVLKGLDGFGLFLSILRLALRLNRDRAFDLVDAHFAYPEGFAGILLGRVLRRPVTITLRGREEQFFREAARRAAIAWSLRRADKLIAVSRSLADFAIRAGAAPARVAVVRNGVDTGLFGALDRGEARRLVQCDHRGPLIVSVGHLSARKGFQHIVQVFPRLLGVYPDLRLVIVGGPGAEGDNSHELKKMLQERRLDQKVLLAGPAAPNGVAHWLAGADVFVLASSHEGCPNVVLEALACGTPVVAADVGDVRHTLGSAHGVVYQPANDLEQLETALLRALRTTWNRQVLRDHVASRTWAAVATEVHEHWLAACEHYKDVNGRVTPPGSQR